MISRHEPNASDSALHASKLVGAEEASDGVADSVLLAGPEVAVDIEGDLRGLVPERRLHLLRAATRAALDRLVGELQTGGVEASIEADMQGPDADKTVFQIRSRMRFRRIIERRLAELNTS
jgi:hypothetical protein